MVNSENEIDLDALEAQAKASLDDEYAEFLFSPANVLDLIRRVREAEANKPNSDIEHTFKEHEAGDGYTSPSEFWVSCSCGAVVWAYSQEHDYDAERDGTPESAKAEHLAAVRTGKC